MVYYCRLQYIYSIHGGSYANQSCNTDFPNRAWPKDALRTLADQEHRSITNMVEVLIRDYCDRKGISIDTAKQQTK